MGLFGFGMTPKEKLAVLKKNLENAKEQKKRAQANMKWAVEHATTPASKDYQRRNGKTAVDNIQYKIDQIKQEIANCK